jgi:L-asparagine oxygenase
MTQFVLDPPPDLIKRVRLSDDLSQHLLADLLDLEVSPYEDVEVFIARAMRSTGRLPESLVRLFLTYRNNESCAPGALLLSNLPRDPDLPPTPPAVPGYLVKRTFISEACLTVFGRLVGELFAYFAEKFGALFHDVKATPAGLHSLSNEGSTADFDLHVEIAFDQFRPDHLALYCLRADHEHKAATIIADARRACSLLTPEQIEALRRADFQIRAGESFRKGLNGQDEWSERVAVLTGPEEFVELRVNLNHMRALSQSGEAALTALRTALHSPSAYSEVVLEPGDLLLVNNKVCAHGRRPFLPRFDGLDRWLQRTYLRADLWPGRSRMKVSPRVF